MARGSAVAVVALAVAAVLLVLHADGAAAAGPKKPATAARREDVPYIRCQVCERIAREISAQVARKQQALSPSKKVPEIEIIEIAENVCNLKKQEADWMLRIDIVEKGDRLELVDQDEEGHCNSECKTIERACQEVMGYADTDVAEFVYTNKPSLDQLVKFVCKDITKACAVDPPSVPKDRVPGEPFAAKPSKDAEMEKIMRSMGDIPGAPSMKMYSRDDLMQNNFGAGGDDDEDDDEDDEDNFPKNLGKALKDKPPQKNDIKEQVVKQIKDTGKKLKGHVSKVSKVVKKWWQAKKPTKSGKSEL
ncbi:uncharacterized protein LOC100845828 [Brachypodium distachyon]|uniref:Saposin B-type domain-containing protein n=1 Tax=Brachypodium distachyon TaxID=15368 RepID=I1H1J5_BRADI|nr:uncharacterized protein LOC100845828 [Brachypodium distachyon]KQK19844.1 hypothetical protein BRADI_1g50810v3 [Brachypodium distachyon]|eukprot:XP_003557182.1 uncharacterized protein LOC100845828 [Brachypodium distachyon]